jgi:hypothetical protein
MTFAKATARYEAWLGERLTLMADDLAYKHEQMRLDPFPFLRATFYRWAQIWREHCAEAAKAPEVLSVGDLHIENFGTWRDSEGRLIWGVNDFDEAWRLPYTNDLIRLTTSALLAPVVCKPREIASAILAGYADALNEGGRPFALAERHSALRTMATARLHEPERFWQKLESGAEAKEAPGSAIKALTRSMPAPGLHWRLVRRRAGLGSLGRERYAALVDWAGGRIAREAKAIAPSGCAWAEGRKPDAVVLCNDVLERAIRCHDPFVRIQKRWIVRRLAPDCSRIELATLPKERDEARLLHAMGWETANVHLGGTKAKVIQRDLERRTKNWLLEASRKMQRAVLADFGAQ